MEDQDPGNELRRNAKGKERASDERRDEPDRTGSRQNNGNSTLSRIAKSAAALPSALFQGGVAANEIPRLGGDEKGSGSRSCGRVTRVGESSSGLRPGIVSGDAIGPRRTQEHIAQEEASFAAFLDGTDIDQSSSLEDHQRTWQSTSTAPIQVNLREGISSVAEQEGRDGEDVVALLSAGGELEPDFTPSEIISDRDMSNIRKALFGEGEGLGDNISPVAWDNVLNFIPRYFQQAATPSPAQAASELPMHFGAVHVDEAWQAWMGQWSRVLTGYQDEVWGDLGSLIEEARGEVKRLEEVRPWEKPPQPTALLRLRAILGHLRSTEQS